MIDFANIVKVVLSVRATHQELKEELFYLFENQRDRERDRHKERFSHPLWCTP